jgi:hypothetical protein
MPGSTNLVCCSLITLTWVQWFQNFMHMGCTSHVIQCGRPFDRSFVSLAALWAAQYNWKLWAALCNVDIKLVRSLLPNVFCILKIRTQLNDGVPRFGIGVEVGSSSKLSKFSVCPKNDELWWFLKTYIEWTIHLYFISTLYGAIFFSTWFI